MPQEEFEIEVIAKAKEIANFEDEKLLKFAVGEICDRVSLYLNLPEKASFDRRLVRILANMTCGNFIKFESAANRTAERAISSLSDNGQSISYQNLVKESYLKDGGRRLKVTFLTPTSFKQDGRYVIFPTVRLIFQSLMMKFDKSSSDMEVFGKDILETFENYTEITMYKLRSTYFHLDGTKIPAFIGDITITVKGPAQLVNLANLLLKFGTYSGVGIKTGIGMGGIAFEQ